MKESESELLCADSTVLIVNYPTVGLPASRSSVSYKKKEIFSSSKYPDRPWGPHIVLDSWQNDHSVKPTALQYAVVAFTGAISVTSTRKIPVPSANRTRSSSVPSDTNAKMAGEDWVGSDMQPLWCMPRTCYISTLEVSHIVGLVSEVQCTAGCHSHLCELHLKIDVFGNKIKAALVHVTKAYGGTQLQLHPFLN
jgi:hypothetical protein